MQAFRPPQLVGAWLQSACCWAQRANLAGVGVQRTQGGALAIALAVVDGAVDPTDVFVARTRLSGSYFVGTRLTLRPWPQLEIALSRTAQWGGRGRPQSLDSFMKCSAASASTEIPSRKLPRSANEMAGYDVRWHCGPWRPLRGPMRRSSAKTSRANLPGRFLSACTAWRPGRLTAGQRWFAE